MKKTYILILILLCMTSCSNSKDIKSVDNILRLSIPSDPKTFNIIVSQDTTSSFVSSLMFEGLVKIDGITMETKPNLAESWKVDESGKKWTFKLRQDVLWNDGKKFTADDVVFTFNKLIYNKDIPTGLRNVLSVSGKFFNVTKIDDYTVLFELPVPFAPFLDQISCPILPEHKLSSIVDNKKFTYHWGVDTNSVDIVGTGPFMMAKYLPGQRIILKKNPYYWDKDDNGKSLPYIEHIAIIIVPDKNTEILKFIKDEIDIIGINPKELSYVKKENKGGYEIFNTGPSLSSNFMVLNQSSKYKDKDKLDLFTNEKFKKALSYAIDRKSISKNIFYGMASPQFGPLTEANKKFFNKDIIKYEYNPEKSIKLLGELGLNKIEGKEFLTDKKGSEISFNIFTNTESRERVDVCNVIKQDLKKIGIKLNVIPLQFNLLVSKITTTSDWDAIYLGFSGSRDPHSSKNVWSLAGGLHIWNMKPDKNNILDWEREIHDIFNKAASELDFKKRKKLYDKWQYITSDKLPLIYTIVSEANYGVSKRVKNIKPSGFAGVLHNIEELELVDI